MPLELVSEPGGTFMADFLGLSFSEDRQMADPSGMLFTVQETPQAHLLPSGQTITSADRTVVQSFFPPNSSEHRRAEAYQSLLSILSNTLKNINTKTRQQHHKKREPLTRLCHENKGKMLKKMSEKFIQYKRVYIP
jgi:hypothetical protein